MPAPQTQSILKLSAALLALALGAGLLWGRLRDARNVGETGAQVWFYDQSEKALYAVPRDTLPPHKGIGGAAHDGVRAVVAAPRLATGDPAQRRIAYLETYAPALRELFDGVQAAQAAHRPYPGPMPSRDSDFFGTNTLVRRAQEAVWHPASSAQGIRIMSEWHAWRGPDGQPLVICVP